MLSSPTPTNPSFDTDAANWTANGPALQITRDTGVFDTSPASGKVSRTDLGYIAVGSYVETPVNGTHEVGTIYVAEIRIRRDDRQVWRLWYGYKNGTHFEDAGVATFIHPGPAASWATARVAFVPHATRDSSVYLRIEQLASVYDPYALTAVTDFHIDSIRISRSKASALDISGTIRTAYMELQSAAPLTTISDLADKFLGVHGKDRLTGNLTVPAGDVQRLPSGEEVHPSELLNHTHELIHIPWVLDRATGNLGCNGRIASVSYNDAGFATVAIDERSDDLEALMSQMGASVSSGR